MSHGLRFAELFAGVGLVGEGLAAEGWQCAWANDWSEVKRTFYVARNGPSVHYRCFDVREVERVACGLLAARVQLVTASFPCTDLSVAGRQAGLAGPQSSAFFAVAEALNRCGLERPRLVLLENVLGFLSANGGQDCRTALAALARLGYWLDLFVLDARHFLPQSRPRVFVVGCREPRVGSGRRHARQRPERVRRLRADLTLPTGWLDLDLPDQPERTQTLAAALADDGDDWWTGERLERHLAMMGPVPAGAFVGAAFRRTRRGRVRLEVRADGLAGCLRTLGGGSARQIVVRRAEGGPVRLRWMRPAEAAALQGAPGFPDAGRPQALMSAMGDAVCVPAVTWVARHALRPLAVT